MRCSEGVQEYHQLKESYSAKRELGTLGLWQTKAEEDEGEEEKRGATPALLM